MKKILLIFLLFLFLMNAKAKDYSIDIKIEKDVYSMNEFLNYFVEVYEDGKLIKTNVDISLTNANYETIFHDVVETNKEYSILLNENFESGYWKIKADYKENTITKIFLINVNESAQFFIKDDELKIRNIGNTPYRKNIQIILGQEIISYYVNIPVKSETIIKILAPKGDYDIEVTDGERRYIKKNVHFVGTGNVISAIDKELIEKQPLIGLREVQIRSKDILFSNKVLLPLIFIFAIFFSAIVLTFRKKNFI